MLDHELRGNWDEALARADAFLEKTAGQRNRLRGVAHDLRALVLVSRGDVEAAEAEAKLGLEDARESQGEPLVPALADAARVLVAAGRQDEADGMLDELFREHRGDLGHAWLRELPLLLAELDRNQIPRAKFDFDAVGHYSRPDVFRMIVDERAKPVVSVDQSKD